MAYFCVVRFATRPKRNPRKNRLLDSKQKGIYVDAMFNVANGYGEMARQFCKHLDNYVDLGILPHGAYEQQLIGLGLGHTLNSYTKTPDSLFSIQPTFSSMRPAYGKKSCIFTMFETSKLYSAWCRSINTFDLLITPSHANAVCFSEQLKIPIEVANQGYDPDMFTFYQSPSNRPFIFGAAAHVGHGRTRKGIERIIDWFIAAFPENKDVRLSLKLNTWPENGIIPDDSRISLIEKDLTDEACRDWLRSIHCYIDGSTFEGWGMWNHNAMATGRPVIGTNYSARCEYFKFGNHIPIGYKIAPAKDQYQGMGHWAMPDRSDAIEAMRWAFNNPLKCQEIGLKAHESVKHLTWERFTKRVLFLLKKHGVIDRFLR